MTYLIVVGGSASKDNILTSQNTVDIYHINKNTGEIQWLHQQGRPAPIAWTRAGITELNGQLYITGGYIRLQGSNPAQYRVGRYSVKTDTWELFPNLMTVSSHGPVLFIHNCILYAVEGDSTHSKTMQSLDLSSLNLGWRKEPISLPYNMYNPNIGAQVGDRIFICGGGLDYSDTVISWNPSTEHSFAFVRKMNVARLHHCVVSDQLDRLFAVGGCGESCRKEGFIEEFQISMGIWTKYEGFPALDMAVNDIRSVICVYTAGRIYTH